jgi:formate dehydrogenase major subunit
LVKGDSANDLVALSEEPNVRIMESKALLCNVFPGRRERGPRALKQWENVMRQPARRRMVAQ